MSNKVVQGLYTIKCQNKIVQGLYTIKCQIKSYKVYTQ